MQFYPSCWQITITGGTGTKIPEGVSFPGAYQHDDPGIEFRTNRSDIKSYVSPYILRKWRSMCSGESEYEEDLANAPVDIAVPWTSNSRLLISDTI
jgi:hypothetical protein